MKEIVLIVSKTQMQKGVCVGGIIESTGELIRIHDCHGANLPADAPYEIGDRWLLDIQTAWNVRQAPHTEDKQTSPIQKLDSIGVKGIIEFIHSHNLGNRLVNGGLDETFERCLRLCTTKNYINREHTPSFSTQFWINDAPLVHHFDWGKHYYYYNDIRLKFVGFQEIVDVIPKGSIVRLSLANWWKGDGSGEERCYLQLSGWYINTFA